jgi:hypothetical protein
LDSDGDEMISKVTVDIRGLDRRFANLRKNEIPSAIRNTLNDLAKDNRAMIVREIPQVFDRPVPIVKGMPRYVSTNNRELQSKLELTGFGRGGKKSSASWAFLPHIPGEPDRRRPKGLEPRMRKAGLMTSSEWLMPTDAAPRDAYGNVKPSEVGRMIADIGAFQQGARDAWNTKRANLAKGKGRNRAGIYFWLRRKSKGAASGIFRRIGNQIAPMFIITREPRYKKTFRWADTVKRYTATRIDYHAQRAIAQAIRKRG